MIWTIEFTSKARKDIARLTVRDQRRIADFLTLRVAAHENPRMLAKRLVGAKDERWRFRVGDFRIIARFENAIMTILVIEIGNRREIYR
jgi:mRNA interferase RelE/StbE